MRYRSIRRLVGTSIVVGGLTMGVLAGPVSSGAATSRAGSSNLTVAWGPGTVPTSVFPFYDAYQCTTTNIDYWYLMSRPGLWFGLGNSISLQTSLSPLSVSYAINGSGDTVAKVVSKGWKWSNANSGGQSETVGQADINFWLNMDKAQSKQGYDATCGYAPTFGIPDAVKSVSNVGGNEVDIVFKGKENQNWLTYNEVSQIDPMPSAWDTTGGGNAGCAAESFASVKTDGSDACSSVFNYLSGLQINNALWNWADGPYRQKSAGYSSGNPDGNDVMIANTNYSGPSSDKAKAVKTITFVPYTQESAEASDLKAGKIDLGYLDPTDVAKSPGPGKAGAINKKLGLTKYKSEGSVLWGVFYWMFNFDNKYSTYNTLPGKAPVWANELNNAYFREAMQEAINQPGVIAHVLNGYGIDTYSAIPAYPKNSFATGVTNPYKFSAKNAKALMVKNGWVGDVCKKKGANGCGTSAYPIPTGSKSTVQLLYPSGDTAVTTQINDEIATVRAAGINIQGKSELATDVQDACFGGAAAWQICGYGGWIYAPDFYPSGEVLFAAGSSSNSGGYDSTEMNGLVAATTVNGSIGLNQKNPTYGTSFAQFTASNLPFLWQPTPAGFSIVLDAIKGMQPLNPLGDFNPEYITAL